MASRRKPGAQDGRGPAGRRCPGLRRDDGGPAWPETKWRPASLPASTVPGSVGPARRRNRLSQGGSGRGLAAPVGPSGSFAGILLFRFRFLRVPRPALRPASVPWRGPSFSALRLRIPVPYRTSGKRSLSDVLSRFHPPGGFRFRRTLEGKWVRHWLAPPPRASSFRLPGPCFDQLPSEDFRRSPRGRAWERLSVSGGGRALPQEDHCTRFPSRAKRYFGDSACG